MTLKEIVDGLQFTLDMFLFDPTTGETYPEPRNDMDKTTIDACKGAIELLEQTRWIPVSEGFPKHKDILVMDKGEDMFVAWYESEGLHEGWHSTDNRFDYDTPIIAWKPLPTPYKEGDKE